MRIGVALNLLVPENGGVTNYALSLLRHWHHLAPGHPLTLFSFDHNESLLSTLPGEARRHEIRLKTQEEALEHFRKIDVYFCPLGTLWPRPVRKPSVLTFHDMQERFYPEFFTPQQHAERFFHYDWSLRMADSVVAISEFSRDMAVRLAGASRRKIHVVHHVPDELPEPVRPAAWPGNLEGKPFVFYPANFWKHKNHARLIEAVALAKAAGSPLHLVCTGARLGREAEWAESVRAAGVDGRVVHLDKISRAEISWLYREARALVFPSLFEGFGIPLLEAMQAGCPISCGHNSSQTDVARDAALYFDASNPRAIAAGLLRIDRDEPLRTRLAAAGRERLKLFTSERLVKGHLAAFSAAVRRYTPWSVWYNERIRLPRSANSRTALTEREARRAAELLNSRAQAPRHYEVASA